MCLPDLALIVRVNRLGSWFSSHTNEVVNYFLRHFLLWRRCRFRSKMGVHLGLHYGSILLLGHVVRPLRKRSEAWTIFISPSPPSQQSQKRHAAAMVRSGTSRGSTESTGGDKRYKYGPSSLAPLPQRPYDMTEEQNAAILQAQVDALFGPKPAPPPKEKVPEKMIDHFIRMARAPAPKLVGSSSSSLSSVAVLDVAS